MITALLISGYAFAMFVTGVLFQLFSDSPWSKEDPLVFFCFVWPLTWAVVLTRLFAMGFVVCVDFMADKIKGK